MRLPRLVLLLFACPLMMYAQVDAVVNFTSSNLPIVVINTNGQPILDDPKIQAQMGIIDNGTARNNVTDPFNDYTGKIGIEIRGSSSQMFPKKQYGIELWDEEGEGISASLLGMPEEEDWVLFAPYNDKSLMRDALAYGLGRRLGTYSPRARYCEVVLNDVYQGVYVLIEKIKRDKNRLDINKLDPDEVEGNNLTGGYIIKIDKMTGSGGDGWTSTYKPPRGASQTIYYQYETPDAEDIVAAQKNYIANYVKQFEDALHGSNFADPAEGYAKYMDVDSFVDYLIMQELTKNVDGYRLSTFMHKKRDSDGGKLHMGPIWDFNLGFGNADYCDGGAPEGWAMDFNQVCAHDFWLIPFWWDKLLMDDVFGARVASRWSVLRAGAFSNTSVLARIDSMRTLLGEAQQRNFTAWKVLGKYVWPNHYVGASFQEEVNFLKKWVTDRLAWMDNNLPALVTAAEEQRAHVAVSAVPNPFSGEVSIQYTLGGGAAVDIRISDALGRTVDNFRAVHDTAGTYSYHWQAVNRGSGIYYYNVRADSKLVGAGKLSSR